MRPRGRGCADGERGASLVIALVYLVVVALVVTALAGVALSSLELTKVVDTREDQLFAADGGVDYGINELLGDDTICASVAGGQETIASGWVLNGRPVDITCETIDGSTGSGGGGGIPGGGPAMVLTGASTKNECSPTNVYFCVIDSTTDPNKKIAIGGDVYNKGQFRFSGTSPRLEINGDLDQAVGTNCQLPPSTPPQMTVTGSHTCNGANPPAAPTLGTSGPPPNAPAPVAHGSNCTILFPGRYASKPNFSSGQRYYLASGVYYFVGTGEITLAGEVFGGQPGSGETQQLQGITPCANDADAESKPNSYVPSGTGVRIVLGGNATLKIDSSTSAVELYQRQPVNAAAEGTAGVSIFEVQTTANGWTRWDDSVTRALVTDNEQPTLVVHGIVYIPRSAVKIRALPNNAAPQGFLFGSLWASSVYVEFNSGALAETTRFAGSAGEPATPRTIVVRATADSTSASGKDVVTTAVVVIDTSNNVTVESWRVS